MGSTSSRFRHARTPRKRLHFEAVPDQEEQVDPLARLLETMERRTTWRVQLPPTNPALEGVASFIA
jgi:hypothetical protein